MQVVQSPDTMSPRSSPLVLSTRNAHTSRLDSLLDTPRRLFASRITGQERQKRKQLKIQVVTQPVLQPPLRDLPQSPTRLLTLLYEALTQARNCEVGLRLKFPAVILC